MNFFYRSLEADPSQFLLKNKQIWSSILQYNSQCAHIYIKFILSLA